MDPNSTRVEPCPIPFPRVRGQGASWRPLKIPQELGTQTHNAVQPVTEVLVVTGTPPNEAVKTSGSGSMESLRPAWLSLTSRAGVAGSRANGLSVGLFVGYSLRMLVKADAHRVVDGGSAKPEQRFPARGDQRRTRWRLEYLTFPRPCAGRQYVSYADRKTKGGQLTVNRESVL